MNTKSLNDAAEGIASNAWFTLVGRGAMIFGLAIISYLGHIVLDVQSDLKVLAATVQFGMTDRYRATDATRDLQLRDLRIETLTDRLNTQQRRMDQIETRLQTQSR